MRPAPRPGLAFALTLTLVVGCSTTSEGTPAGNAAQQPGDAVVDLVGLTFQPRTLTVPIGRRVLWRWTDSVVHNVVSDDFPSSKTQGGGTYAMRFDTAGTFAYRCTLHTGMEGTVVVTP